MEFKLIKMVISMKAIGMKVLDLEKEIINGLKEIIIKELGKMI